MSETNAPRMRRPSWRDPRLGVGIVLVVASVALGSWVISRADATVAVYQARGDLTPGDAVAADSFDVVQVNMDDVDSLYLVPDADLAEGAVVTRTVAAGELVPLTALGDPDEIDLRPVQVPMSAGLQEVVSKGSLVELWVAMPDPASPQGDLLAPERLVTGVEVRDVYADTSVFAGSDSVQIQVLVPESELSEVLAALAADGEVTVVPLLGGG